MGRFTIYSKDGQVRHDSVTNLDSNGQQVWCDTLEYSGTWMGECFVMVSVRSAFPIDFHVGDYIDYRGERFTLNYVPAVVKKASRGSNGNGFTYDNIKFSARHIELSDIRFWDVVIGDNNLHYSSLPVFQFHAATVDDLCDRLQANVNRYCESNGISIQDWWLLLTPDYQRSMQRATDSGGSELSSVANDRWELVYGSDHSNPRKNDEGEITDVTVGINHESVWDGCARIKNDFGLNFINRGRTVYVAPQGKQTDMFRYGKNNGLYEIERVADQDQQIVTKLTAYGNTTNLPVRYYANKNLRCYGTIIDVGEDYALTNIPIEYASYTRGQQAPMLIEYDGDEYYVEYVPIQHSGDIFLGVSMNQGTPAFAVNGKIYFLWEDVDKWPVSFREGNSGMPNNMAVDRLMLPGFPDQSLYDWVIENGGTPVESDYNDNDKGLALWEGYQAFFSKEETNPYIISEKFSVVGIREGDKFFDGTDGDDDIFPTIENTGVDYLAHADVIEDNGIFAEGDDTPRVSIWIPLPMSFGLDKIIARVSSSSIVMKSGYCGGRELPIKSCSWDGVREAWEVVCEREHDTLLDLFFPYSYGASIGNTAVANEPYQLRGSSISGYSGDKYIITGIEMTGMYVEASARRLLLSALEWLKQNDYARESFLPKVDELYMVRQHEAAKASQEAGDEDAPDSLYETLKEGDLMLFGDDDLLVSGSIFIDHLTIRENGNAGIPTYEVTLREEKQVSSLQRTVQQIVSKTSTIVNYGIISGGGGGGSSSSSAKSFWEEYTDPQTGNVSVKLKSQYAGAWTEGFLSALGYGPGGGGGGVTLNEPLESINNSGLSTPGTNQNGKTIVWNNTTGKWEYGTAGGGTDLNAVWDSLRSVDSSKQIDLSHLTTALAGYATQSWVTSQGYLTSLPSHNHDDRYKFGTIGVGTVQITLGGTTNSVLTSHQSLADYVKTIQLGTNGTVYSPTSGKVTLPAYPTTLPASDVYSWAKAANKPSYSFSEIANHPTTLAGYGITDALPLSGGTMTGQIYSATGAGAWIKGRDNALIRKDITNTSSWWPILSVKTADGSWEMGAISDNDDVKNALILSYATDDNYNANTNNVMRILFPKSAGTLALLSDNIASATRLASNDTKTLFGITYWSGGQPQNIGTSWSNTANLNYVDDITMKGILNGAKSIELNNNQNGYLHGYGGVIDFHYNASTDYTSRIIEDKNGRLNFNGTAFIYKSNKPGKDDDFPGGKLDETTDWGGYPFRNVFTNNSLFENTLFLRADLYMKTNTGIRIKNYTGADVTALSLESNSSNNSIVVGAGAHNVAGISTYIRGYSVNFQTANGAGSTLVGHFSNDGNFYIDAAGKSLYMNDGTGTRGMIGINIPDTHFHLCFGATGANWQTRIYGGGGDDKGISFYHGSTTLAAGISGGDHSFVAYYHIKLTTNNQSFYTRNTNNTQIDTIRLTSGNILYFGYGCSTQNHETRIYGGATAGIGFYCGSTEVARVHKDNARQGIRIGDGLLSWDSDNNAFKVSKIDGQGNEVAANLYALGGVSALGFLADINNPSISSLTVGGRLTIGTTNNYLEYASGSTIDDLKIRSTGYVSLLGASDSMKVRVYSGSLYADNIIEGVTIRAKSVSGTVGSVTSPRFYFDSSTYLYLEGSSLKITNGTTTKTITTL